MSNRPTGNAPATTPAARLWTALFTVLALACVTRAPASMAMEARLRADAEAVRVDTVRATGPEAGSALEDRVEVSWSLNAAIAPTSTFAITRDDDLIHVAASTVSLYYDQTAAPNVPYEYCVYIRPASGPDVLIDCAMGGRTIARPSGFSASDGQSEEHVLLAWSDHSQIEGGYNIYRNAGNALVLDGSNDYVALPGNTLLSGSFTIEFWARRASVGTTDFVVNIESTPQGDPVRRNLEIGFTADNRFSVAFGTDLLNTTPTHSDLGWHHWAIVYDAPDRRRFVYRDGELVANDVASGAFIAEGSLEFGRRRKGGNAATRGHFHGRLDEVRRWDRALTREEVVRARGALVRANEAGLMSYWPMDATSGLVAPDVVGSSAGTLVNMAATSWAASEVSDRYTATPANITSYVDGVAAPGFQSYTYRLRVFEDIDGDGAYTAGRDYESEQRTDTGWRGRLSPPGNVVASDGQFLDRVRVVWDDRSEAEEGFYVYRGGTRVGTVAANATQYDDMTAALEQPYEFCVTSFGAGAESTQACDTGQRGGLAAPDSLVASYDQFDDRITLSWAEESGSGQGFELFRSDTPFPTGAAPQEDDRIATLGAAARQYNDLTAAQGADYHYCIRSFSKLDPLAPSYSDPTCTDSPGRRAIVLEPTELLVSDAEFEDRVELKWKNPSTTAMLFLVYRDDVLIEVLDRSRTAATDRAIPSGTDIPYCVSAATVVNGNAQSAQATVAQVLANLRVQDATREGSGLARSTAEVRMDAVYSALGFESEGGLVAASAFAAGYVESDSVCTTGSRLMEPPTDVTATNDEFETHVRIEWSDNSQVETGYHVLRSQGTSAPTVIDTLSANRTTYSDYRGTPGQPFTYTVEAFDAFGVSAPASDEGRRTLKPATQFTGTDGTSETTVRLSWNDNSAGELGYRIYRRRAGSGEYVLIDSTRASVPGYTDVVPDTLRAAEFEYQVAAFDKFGESLRATARGKTFIQAPANVNASSVYNNRVVVVWVDRSAVEGNYVLTRRAVGTRPISPEVVLGANATSYIDTPSQVGTEYEYCVRARINASSPVLSPPTCGIGQRLSTGTTGGGGDPVDPGDGPVRLTDPSLTSNRDNALRFGYSVATSEDSVALIGIPGADPEGQASLYSTDGLTSSSTPGTTFLPALGAMFGHSVDLSGDYAVIGDPFTDSDNLGAFAVWKRTAGVWSKWTDKPGETNSGFSVAIVDSFVVVGDNQYGSSPSGHGGAFVCNVEADSTCASPVRLDALITKSANARFGHAVGITRVRDNGSDALYAVVGAPSDRKAYVFECDLSDLANAPCTAQADWTLERVIESPFRNSPRAFGTAVAIDSSLVIVGDPDAEGLAIWERSPGGGWSEQQLVPGRVDDYGSALAIRRSSVIVGAPGEDVADRVDAGAVYVYEWRGGALQDSTRYDAGVAKPPVPSARFGTSVGVAAEGFYVGAPDESGRGAVYAIPRGFVQPATPITPIEVDLVDPANASASDGTAPDRIQIRWTDEAENEAGHVVYRSIEGGDFERLSEVSADVEFYDDFAAQPGEAYTYCVAAFSLAPYVESGRSCDIGWRPANGTIAGRVASGGGAGTADAVVCLSPSVNRGLLLDGAGGYVGVPLDPATADDPSLAFDQSFTVEAWIRPQAVDGSRTIVSRDSSFTLAINDGNLSFTVIESDLQAATLNAGVSLSVGTWYHVAVVRGDDNKVRFYLDGAPTAPAAGTGLLASPKTDSTMLWIGQIGDGTAFFSGEIDEVRVWSTARDSTEIADTRRAALTGKEESLAAYWPLDEGARLVVPDLTKSANHGTLAAGIYSTDQGADLDVCGRTTSDGNYSISRIRYGETTEFDVSPTFEGREFLPGFKKITLSLDSPVQNEVFFSDVTAYTVAGVVKYEDIVGSDTLSYPVSDVSIHVDKGDLPSDDNLKITTGADGSYAVAVDPSTSAADTWFIMTTGPNTADTPHTILPAAREIEVRADSFGIDFLDQRRHLLSGYFSGGDPGTCGKDIGTAEIRVYTQDGGYERMFTVNSAANSGAFSWPLPPLEYLVEVVSVTGAPAERAEDIGVFFGALGAVEVDLTAGDLERNLTYRAPLTLVVEGLEASCDAGLIVNDQDGNTLLTLPPVAVLDEFEFAPLQISVTEDYGDGQTCNVSEGTITIFDGIADQIDSDSTLALTADGVEYSTFGASPNVFSGARIDGVDRSFQKPITVVAQIEGRPALVETRWAIVNGFLARPATFVSATTQEFPLVILHDPPGSNSRAFIEEGKTMCTRFSNMKMVGGGAGAVVDLNIGITAKGGFSFGAHLETGELGAGFHFATRTTAGQDYTSLNENGQNREFCMTATETWSTSDDPGWVGEDLHMGVALNLIFALADVLEARDDGPLACTVDLSEELATDLDSAKPFETAYVYGNTHIEYTLIPQLENLIRLAGDGTLSGTVDGNPETVRLQEAVANWRSHLTRAEEATEQALDVSNHSFSGGAEVGVSTSNDTTSVTRFESTRTYISSENEIGAVFKAFFDQKFAVAFDVRAEWLSEEEQTTSTSSAVGYVLSDNDGGDYHSVDIGRDPNYGTYVFNTVAGRTSNPCESETQCRDTPLISVDPVVRYNVDPSDAANFQLTLTNASASRERRRYVIMAPPETNTNNLALNVAGGMLTSPREYVLEPGKSLTVNMDVFASSSSTEYERVGVMMYPPDEFPIWGGYPAFPFGQSDTTFFSVYFNSSGALLQTAQMSAGWNWFSINREGGDVNTLLDGVPAAHGDLLKSQRSESRYDSTAGWVGDLARLAPGEGYRVRLRNAGLLRVEGEAVEAAEPLALAPGWTWIGYIPTKRMPLDVALASLEDRVIDGDAIVGRESFAHYVKGVGWVGTLRQMLPGESYAIHMKGGGELSYPPTPEAPIPSAPYVHETTTEGPEWVLDSRAYDASMTVVGEIRMHGDPLRQTTMKVAAFDGEEIRGVGEVHYVEALDRYLTYLMLFGGVDEKKPLVVSVYDGEADELYEAVATINYEQQGRLGHPTAPVVFELADAGQAPELSDLPEVVALHPNFPNPVNEYTIIGYDLPEPARVKLAVYDILGRQVSTLVDGEQVAGRHQAVFDAKTVASGVYFYRLEMEDTMHTGRMVIVR